MLPSRLAVAGLLLLYAVSGARCSPPPARDVAHPTERSAEAAMTASGTPGRKPNHLAGQTSPYLLQHLYNPVSWYAWGPEPLERAVKEGKPIFLSIGYAACHWCHVMERESFENEEVAAFLNDRFIAIKVDREERPDLDEIYMNAVQMLTGSGGWPLNVFLTPRLEPFFGGTYFPPDDRHGRPGFLAVLRKVDEAWRSRRPDVEKSAAEIRDHLRSVGTVPAGAGGDAVGRRETARAVADLSARFDPQWGGFGAAPKFPPHGGLALLLREHARTGEAGPLRLVETTLERMARGGMYDQIGGGFARYSTDERWLVPHFEKMLYDQALLVPVYVDAWRMTGKPLYRRVVLETLDFVRREMTGPDGGFFASLDADSEGHEGTFYVWTPEELKAILGPEDGAVFGATYGIALPGNFEGKSIPNLLGGPLADEAMVARLAPMKAKLLTARGKRVRPATDDKVLTAWNGLMISAFARGYDAFGRDADLKSARAAAEFVRAHLSKDDRLLVSFRDGKAHLNAYLDDYAFLARGLVDLYEAEFDRRDLDRAATLARTLLGRFGDGRGGFHFTSDDHEEILARTRSTYDDAIPAGSAIAAEALLRLSLHLDDAAFRKAGLATLAALRPLADKAPVGCASLLNASAYADTASVLEIAIVGPRDAAGTMGLLAAARARYLPARVIGGFDPAAGPSDLPLLAGKTLSGGKPAAYVCRNYACDKPVTDPASLRKALEGH
jgi:uncharacterized protein YyaL (SSP411 family)